MANTGSFRAASWVKKPVQQPHRFGRGNGLVVKVACQQHAVHRGLIQQGLEFVPEYTADPPAWKTRTPACPDAGRTNAENANRNTAFQKNALSYYSAASRCGRNQGEQKKHLQCLETMQVLLPLAGSPSPSAHCVRHPDLSQRERPWQRDELCVDCQGLFHFGGAGIA